MIEYAKLFIDEGGDFPVTFCRKHNIEFTALCDAVDELIGAKQ